MINSQVILIEPYFDCYFPQISVAGGIPKFIPLRPVSTYMYIVTLSFSRQFRFKKLTLSSSSTERKCYLNKGLDLR